MTNRLEEFEVQAMNIVYQIGDLLYTALPPDIAHEHFVKARQSTNDLAIEFTKKIIQQTLDTQRAEIIEELGGYPPQLDVHGHVKYSEKQLKEYLNTQLFMIEEEVEAKQRYWIEWLKNPSNDDKPHTLGRIGAMGEILQLIHEAKQ
jgi:hypothetical protein